MVYTQSAMGVHCGVSLAGMWQEPVGCEWLVAAMCTLYQGNRLSMASWHVQQRSALVEQLEKSLATAEEEDARKRAQNKLRKAQGALRQAMRVEQQRVREEAKQKRGGSDTQVRDMLNALWVLMDFRNDGCLSRSEMFGLMEVPNSEVVS